MFSYFKRSNQLNKFSRGTNYLRVLLAIQILFAFTVSPALAIKSINVEPVKNVGQISRPDLVRSIALLTDEEKQEANEQKEISADTPVSSTTTDKKVEESDKSPTNEKASVTEPKAIENDSKTEVVETIETKDVVDTKEATEATEATESAKSTEATEATKTADKTELKTEEVADPKEASEATEATEEIDSKTDSTDLKTEATEVEEAAKIAIEETNDEADVEEEQENKKVATSEGAEQEDDDLSFLKEGYVEKEDENVIYIDNDELEIVKETIAYEELPTNEAKTRIKAGAKFPVVMVSNISSKTAKKGDILQARLKYDLKIGPKLIAKKGSLVTGHIDYNMKARTVLHSMVSPHRWYRNSGCIGLIFDEIINDKNEHIALNAKPARKDRIVKNKAEGRLLGVNHDGQITGPWGQQLRYKAVRVGLNAALAPAGVFSFGAMPVALGVMGAVNPSFAFMKPVGTNVPHRRIKGFCWGFLSGIPGSWIIEDTVTKGQEALIRPGDEFLVELHQEFTGEVLTEAQLIPGASGKVSGDVDDERLEKTEKRGIFKFKKLIPLKKGSKSSSKKTTKK